MAWCHLLSALILLSLAFCLGAGRSEGCLPLEQCSLALLSHCQCPALLGQKAHRVLKVFPLHCPCELADESILCTSHSKQSFMAGLQSRQKNDTHIMQRRAVKHADLSSLLSLSLRKLSVRDGLFSACQSGCLLWEAGELLS